MQRSLCFGLTQPVSDNSRGLIRSMAVIGSAQAVNILISILRMKLLAILLGPKPLVRQRMHDDNTGTGYTIASPARWNRFIQSKLIAFRNMQIDLARWSDELDSEISRRIERRILGVLGSTSGLLLPETRAIRGIGSLKFAFRVAGAPAVARSFRLRVEYVLMFFGFNFHLKIKNRLRSFSARVRRS